MRIMMLGNFKYTPGGTALFSNQAHTLKDVSKAVKQERDCDRGWRVSCVVIIPNNIHHRPDRPFWSTLASEKWYVVNNDKTF